MNHSPSRKASQDPSQEPPRKASQDTSKRPDRKILRALGHILRVALAAILIYLSWPPFSLGLINIYVLLPGIAGIAVLLWPLLRRILNRFGEKHARRISRTILALVLAGIIALGISFGLIVNAGTSSTVPDNAVVVVLGAQVINGQPSTILSGRIRAAADYLQTHESAICIASGGQGPDESKSEAAAIRDTLITAYGIEPERILLEDLSTSTRENLAYSLDILDAEGLPRNVLIATDAYHMFRAKRIAEALEMTPYPLPAATDSRLVVPMSLREMMAIWAELLIPM